MPFFKVVPLKDVLHNLALFLNAVLGGLRNYFLLEHSDLYFTWILYKYLLYIFVFLKLE